MEPNEINFKDQTRIEEMRKILESKKQIILYGPPGTGKTWLARKYLEYNSKAKIQNKFFEDKKFFWWSINPERWDYQQIKEEESIEMWEGLLKDAFEKINEGDLVFTYVGVTVKKIYAIGFYEKREGKRKVRIHKVIDGPTWKKLKEDPALKDSKPVRMNARGTLFPLKTDEGLRMLELCNIRPEEIGLSMKEQIKEETEVTKFITFHSSYSYEEFVEGIKPDTDKEGKIKYRVEEGVFKRICRDAFNALMKHVSVRKEWKEGESLPLLSDEEIQKVRKALQEDYPKFYLVIDEINRGDVSKIFGELITLLESDKRLFAENEIVATLPYSKQRFGVPPNLYIIGTMNTADRSIALIDVALRRRFGFLELTPEYQTLIERLLSESNEAREIKELAIKVLKAMNEKIRKLYDRDHQIGHSYFLRLEKTNSREEAIKTLKEIWFYEILPLIQEYFYDSPEKLKEVLEDFVEVENDSYEFKKTLDFDDEKFLLALGGLASERSG